MTVGLNPDCHFCRNFISPACEQNQIDEQCCYTFSPRSISRMGMGLLIRGHV